MSKYIIIGNGTAAAGCIEGIRSVDEKGGITVISAENHPVYCRPLISYYLQGKTDTEKMNYRSVDFYEKNGCDVLYGKKAESLNPESKAVTLDDGSVCEYSSLCVATGSAPFVPPFEGLDSVEKKYTFMTADDAFALEKGIDKSSDVLIVGAGLIGLKCAEGICRRAKSVTVCDLADRILSSILDEECAEIMQKRLEENGIAFMLGDTAVRFDKNTAVMKSGKEITYDVLVLAVGVRANISPAKEAGADIGRGIIINDRMQTSLEGVYAAGDCAEGTDAVSGEKKVLALLPNAYMQGFAAGVNMAGGNRVFDKAIAMNSIGFFGLHAMTAGLCEGEQREEKTENGIKKFFIKDGFLNGFILIGDIRRAGIYTSLVRERTPLDTLDFDTLGKTASYGAFSGKTRRKLFGGAV